MITRLLKTGSILFLFSLFSVSVFSQNYNADARKTYNIIKYANSVVGLNDTYTGALSNYQQILSVADQNMAKIRNGNTSQLTVIDCNSMQINNNMAGFYRAKMDSVFTFAQKTEIDRLVQQAEEVTRNVFMQCSELDNYFARGMYNNDNGCRQYAQIKNNFINAIRQSSLSWNNASQAAVSVANESEISLLRYNKLADFVVPMKMDATTLKNILNSLTSGNDLNYHLIRQRIEQFANSVNINRQINNRNTAILSNPSYVQVYQDFYQHCQNAVNILNSLAYQMESRRDMRDVQNSLSQAQSAYSAAVNAYNYFVKQ